MLLRKKLDNHEIFGKQIIKSSPGSMLAILNLVCVVWGSCNWYADMTTEKHITNINWLYSWKSSETAFNVFGHVSTPVVSILTCLILPVAT